MKLYLCGVHVATFIKKKDLLIMKLNKLEHHYMLHTKH